jgi:hypothetical protein
MTTHKPPVQFGLARLFGVTTVVALFFAVPRDSILWGPLIIVLSEPKYSPMACLMAGLLAAGIASFPMKPGIATGLLAAMAGLIWLFIGLIGQGIGC